MMRRPHVYERSAPRLGGRESMPLTPPHVEAAGRISRGLPRMIEEARHADATALAEALKAARAEALKILADAEQDRKAQDRAWTGRLGIMRQ